MKSIICITVILLTLKSYGQLHSGTPANQSKTQPVPNSTTSEKSAPPQPINIPPAANPVPPVYPGAETKAIEIPRQLINPPSTPSGTQPIQKEPLSPVESTNNLHPNRPPRDRASRENRATALSPVVSNRVVTTSDNNYSSNKTVVTYRKAPVVTTNKRVTSVSPIISNRTINPSDNNYSPNKTGVIYKKAPSVTTNKKPTAVKSAPSKKPVTKKKPR